jgi:hypothetical protein
LQQIAKIIQANRPQKIVWPAFITTDAEIALDNDALAAKLKLGSAKTKNPRQ